MTILCGRILLVDDEEKLLKVLGRALCDAGHEVVETISVRQVQKLLGECMFDLLIVDNMMPEVSGLDLIREYVGSTWSGATVEWGGAVLVERDWAAGAPGGNEDR